jgi:hypothetical protein
VPLSFTENKTVTRGLTVHSNTRFGHFRKEFAFDGGNPGRLRLQGNPTGLIQVLFTHPKKTKEQPQDLAPRLYLRARRNGRRNTSSNRLWLIRSPACQSSSVGESESRRR